jgi:hypothetical protein
MALGQTAIGKINGSLPNGYCQIAIGQMTIIQIAIGQLGIGPKAIGQLCIGTKAIGQINGYWPIGF